MRLSLLTGCAAAALTLIGAAAQAETVYVTEPGYVAPQYVAPEYIARQYTAPGYDALAYSPGYAAPTYAAPAPAYSYSVPGPLPFSRFVVTEHPPVVVEQPPVVAVPRRTVVNRPLRTVVEQPVVAPPREIVTTGYSTVRSCFTDLGGMERCY